MPEGSEFEDDQEIAVQKRYEVPTGGTGKFQPPICKMYGVSLIKALFQLRTAADIAKLM